MVPRAGKNAFRKPSSLLEILYTNSNLPGIRLQARSHPRRATEFSEFYLVTPLYKAIFFS